MLNITNHPKCKQKTTVRYHFRAVRLDMIKTTKSNYVIKRKSCTFLIGMKIRTAMVQNSMVDPQKTRGRANILRRNPTRGDVDGEMKCLY